MKKLNEVKWAALDIQEVFPEIKRGRRLKTDDHIEGEMPYVSSSAVDNGVDDFVSNKEGVRIFNDCLSLANSGSVGATFYHPYEFVASDHVTKLKNPECNKYIYLFLATITSKLSEKYSFNREINEGRLNREKIYIPVDDNGKPDFEFMEQYMRAKEKIILKRYQEFLLATKRNRLKDSDLGGGKIVWREFKIEDVCTVVSGRDIYDRERTSGRNPYITATANNNGVGYFIGNSNETLEAGCLSVNRNGSVGYAFYHPYLALFGNDTRKLRPLNGNRHVCFFLSRAITAQKDKFGYGLKLGTDRLKKQSIMLPSTADGQPDYEYMESYMKSQETRIINRYITNRLNNA